LQFRNSSRSARALSADFIVSSTLTLRDGGMAQYASGTNPLTGQVTRIEVSGEVVK
jgi:hypothetical protein